LHAASNDEATNAVIMVRVRSVIFMGTLCCAISAP
jgi:hypothetical protein